jgi:hypothetical protein
LVELRAQPSSLNPHDWIEPRVERRRPAEHLGSQDLLLEPGRMPQQSLLDAVPQKTAQLRRFRKPLALQNARELRAYFGYG